MSPQHLHSAVRVSAHPLLRLEQRRCHLQQSHAGGQEGLQAGVCPGCRRRWALRYFVSQSGGNAQVEPEHTANQGELRHRRRLTTAQILTLTAPWPALCVQRRFWNTLEQKPSSLTRSQPRLQAIWLARGTLSASDTASNTSPTFISAERQSRWSPSHLWQALWGILYSSKRFCFISQLSEHSLHPIEAYHGSVSRISITQNYLLVCWGMKK